MRGTTVVQSDLSDRNSALTIAHRLVADFGSKAELMMPTQEQQIPQIRAEGGNGGEEDVLFYRTDLN